MVGDHCGKRLSCGSIFYSYICKCFLSANIVASLPAGHNNMPCCGFFLGVCSECMGNCCCWLVGYLTSQQLPRVSQGRVSSDRYTCCHAETEVADQTSCLFQVRYTDTGLTSPSSDPLIMTPSALQGSHGSTNFQVTSMTRPGNRGGVFPLGQLGGMYGQRLENKTVTCVSFFTCGYCNLVIQHG